MYRKQIAGLDKLIADFTFAMFAEVYLNNTDCLIIHKKHFPF